MSTNTLTSKFKLDTLDITCDLQSVQLKRTRTISSFDTFCGTSQQAGSVKATIDFKGQYNGVVATIDDKIDDLLVSAVDFAWEYYPSGSGSGAKKYYGSGVLTDGNVDSSVPGIVLVDGSVAVDGLVNKTRV